MIVLKDYPDVRIQDIRVWGNKEDKEELYRRLERDKKIIVRRSLVEIVEPPLIVTIVLGMIPALKAIYDWLKERKDKNIEVQVSLSDSRVITVKATNPDELKVLIQELAEGKQKTSSL